MEEEEKSQEKEKSKETEKKEESKKIEKEIKETDERKREKRMSRRGVEGSVPILNMIVLNLVNISLSRAHARIRPPYSTFTLFTNLSGLAGYRSL